MGELSPYQAEQFAQLEALLDPSPHSPHSLTIYGPTPTRAAMRALPLNWILFGRPPLSYPDGCNGDALLEHELNELRMRWRRTRDEKQRKLIGYRARRTWARLVEMAQGLNITGTRWPSVVLFGD